jgi:hypothetical protein
MRPGGRDKLFQHAPHRDVKKQETENKIQDITAFVYNAMVRNSSSSPSMAQ